MTINTSKKSANINKGRNGWKPDIIVCHITEGNFDGAVSWLCNPDSQASTHFVVAKDGRVSQLVDLQDTAWGNGTTTTSGDSRFYGNSNIQTVKDRKTNANYYTFSIEHEGFYKDSKGSLTEAQLSATVEVMKFIIQETKRIYGVDIPIDRQHIIGHYDVAPKWKPNCPGQNYPFDEIIKRLKPQPVTQYPISVANLTAIQNLGIINSPDYWRTVTSVQYLDSLLANVAKSGLFDKTANNNITKTDVALNTLVKAGIINSPDYWTSIIKENKIQYLDNLILNIVNKLKKI